jgi:hypothetical protein
MFYIPPRIGAAMKSVAMVIDRPMGARIAKDVHEFGGAWETVFNAWLRLPSMQYLVMMAHTEERIRKRAPLTAMIADDDDALRMALRTFCDELVGKSCQWALFVERGSMAEQITRQELLLDATTQGNA